MTKVKICGITTVADALLCAEAGADFLGLVLSSSPRRVSLESVMGIRTYLDGRVPLVGVFAIVEDLQAYQKLGGPRLDYYQIYFDRPPANSEAPARGWIHSRLVHDTVPQLTLGNGDLQLLDFKESTRTAMMAFKAPLGTDHQATLFAGQLNPDNVAEVVRRFQPFGVDVARGTEREPGRKDPKKVRDFIDEVRRAGD